MRTASLENNVKTPGNVSDEPPNDLKNILSDLGHSTHMTYSSVLSQNIFREACRKI